METLTERLRRLSGMELADVDKRLSVLLRLIRQRQEAVRQEIAARRGASYTRKEAG